MDKFSFAKLKTKNINLSFLPKAIESVYQKTGGGIFLKKETPASIIWYLHLNPLNNLLMKHLDQ